LAEDHLAHIAPFLQHRFAVVGDPQAMRLYRWLEELEESHRDAARSYESKAIDLWQRAIEIRSRPFMPGESTVYPHPTDTLDGKLHAMSAEFRMSQAVLSLGTSKVALDCGINGYYSQSLALCRSLFESWKRMAYARRSSADSFRWYPIDWMPAAILAELGPRYAQSKPRDKEWDKVFPEHAPSGSLDARDRSLLQNANAHIDSLNEHAHLTYLGFTQHLGETRGETRLHPDFDEGLLRYVLREGCIAEFYLMSELWALLNLDDAWERAAETWRRDFLREFGGTDVAGDAS
jgi:hypothetical protein